MSNRGGLRSLVSLFTVVERERAQFAVFSLVSVACGALGIIAPLIVGWYSGQDLWGVATRILKDGNGYTFAIALLAGSSAFIVNGMLDDVPTSYRKMRVVAALVVFSFLAGLFLLSGSHFGIAVQGTEFTRREGVEVACVALSVVFGAWLFCLERADGHEDLARELRDSVRSLVKKAKAPGSASGFEA